MATPLDADVIVKLIKRSFQLYKYEQQRAHTELNILRWKCAPRLSSKLDNGTEAGVRALSSKLDNGTQRVKTTEFGDQFWLTGWRWKKKQIPKEVLFPFSACSCFSIPFPNHCQEMNLNGYLRQWNHMLSFLVDSHFTFQNKKTFWKTKSQGQRILWLLSWSIISKKICIFWIFGHFSQ